MRKVVPCSSRKALAFSSVSLDVYGEEYESSVLVFVGDGLEGGKLGATGGDTRSPRS